MPAVMLKCLSCEGEHMAGDVPPGTYVKTCYVVACEDCPSEDG